MSDTAVMNAARTERPRSLARDAWEDLRKRPLFLVAMVLIVLFVSMAAFPAIFTSTDPSTCDLAMSRKPPSGDAWFGYDSNGCDVYSRTIHGARASIIVGTFTALTVLAVGGFLGTMAGFYGRRVDTLISRVGDIFFGIPLLLGSLLVLVTFPSDEFTPAWLTITKVVVALAILGWPSLMRIMRSSAIQVRSADYVSAARSLGATGPRIIRSHIVPNAVGPVIVVATISLGAYIGVEATLSFLGIGLQPPVISWGVMISAAQPYIRTAPHMLLFPAAALSLCVLSFIMLGDTIRDALDPKLR